MNVSDEKIDAVTEIEKNELDFFCFSPYFRVH